MVGGVNIPLIKVRRPQASGTRPPSSGFFSYGAGTASGFGNFGGGAGHGTWPPAASGTFGLPGTSALGSGVANVGTISGLYNTKRRQPLTPACCTTAWAP